MAKFKKNMMLTEKNYSGSGILSKISFSGKIYLALFLIVAGLVVQCLFILSNLYEYRNDLMYIASSRRTNDDLVKVLYNRSWDMLGKIYISSSSKSVVDFSDDVAHMEQALNNLSDNLNSNDFAKPINNIQDIIDQFRKNGSILTTDGYQVAKNLYDQYIIAVNSLETALTKYYKNNYQEILVVLIIKFSIIFFVLLIEILICKWLISCAIKSIDEPANRIIQFLQNANGDLKVKIPVFTYEGLGATGLLLNDAISKWHGLALEFKNASNKLNYLIDEMTSGFNQVFFLEVQLQEAYREIEASLDEQKQMGKRVDKEIETIISELSELQYLPRKVNQISEEMNSLLAVNKEYLSGLLNKQIEVNNESQGIVNYLKDLATTSKRVDRIMKELDEIEAESEMLAFNSAISAARAGQEGQGFSVVAKEIANLVERSKKASNNLSGLIGQIQEKTEQIVNLAPEKDLVEQNKFSLDKIINSTCTNLSETALKCLNEISIMRQVVETIFIKSNEAFEEISVTSELPQTETNELDEINNIIGHYLESIKHTGEISNKICETVNSLQSATNLLINRNS